jgi:DNA-binding winged helix-turn-helix (wHTH) protein
MILDATWPALITVNTLADVFGQITAEWIMWTVEQDPYREGIMQLDPISDPKHSQGESSESLYGLIRKRDLILQCIYSGMEGPFIVLGLKGVGKSRLLRAVCRDLEKAKPEDHDGQIYHVLDIQPGCIPDRSALAHEIRDGILRFIEKKIGYIPDDLNNFTFTNGSTNQSFVSYLEKVRLYLPDDTIVCIIDHFNQVFESQGPKEYTFEYRFMVAFFTTIKTSYSPSRDRFHLVFLLAMPRRIPLLDLQGWRPQYMKVGRIHNKEDFCQMCAPWAAQYHLPDESLAWLYRYTSGFPNLAFLLMDAASEYVEEYGLPSVDHPSEMIMLLIGQAVKALAVSEELRDWFRSFTEQEQEVLTQMAANGGFISDDTLQQMSESRRNSCDDLCSQEILEWRQEGYTMLVPCMLDLLSPRQVRSRDPLGDVSSVAPKPTAPIVYNGLVIYEKSQRIVIDGQEQKEALPNHHFHLLTYLARQVGKWVPHDELIEYFYSLKDEDDEKEKYFDGAMKSHISRLRDELGPGAKYLRNKRGLGYGLFEAHLVPDE